MKKTKFWGIGKYSAFLLFILLLAISFSSCTLRKYTEKTEEFEPEEKKKTLVCTFIGDIMAHNVNYQMDDYNIIYDDVRTFLLNDDLTFANFEIPVADSLPMATYPKFNVHTPYLLAAVNGGCDVFSLSNNHSADQGLTGIKETAAAVSKIYGEGKIAGFSGLKAGPEEDLKPVMINESGWRILFIAVTQILNIHDNASKLVYYIPPTKEKQAEFKKTLIKMREENPCDLFVVSIHTNEPEYVIKAPEKKRQWFSEIIKECGVDIVWAHHPHVSQEWETVMVEKKERPCFIMYSTGNFISGQRWNINTENPDAMREYTGDAYIFRIAVTDKTLTVIPVLVTNYRNPAAERGSGEWYLTVKHFTKSFMETVPESLQNYYKKRFSVMQEFIK